MILSFLFRKGLDKAGLTRWLEDRKAHYIREKHSWITKNRPEEMCKAKGRIDMINDIIEKLK